MKLVGVALLLLAISVWVLGCGSCDCSGEMSKVRGQLGDAEDVYRYSSGGYHSVEWWYWTKGVAYTFTWGEGVSGCCEKSVYTFPPIRGAGEVEKAGIRVRARFTGLGVTGRGGCLTCPQGGE